jgi:hypothetical protein
MEVSGGGLKIAAEARPAAAFEVCELRLDFSRAAGATFAPSCVGAVHRGSKPARQSRGDERPTPGVKFFASAHLGRGAVCQQPRRPYRRAFAEGRGIKEARP